MKNGIFLLIALGLAQPRSDFNAEYAPVPFGDLGKPAIEVEENNDLVIMNYQDNALNITMSREDAKNSIGTEIIKKSIENDQLLKENLQLMQDISEMETILANALAKVSEFRLETVGDLTSMLRQMNILEGKNEAIQDEMKPEVPIPIKPVDVKTNATKINQDSNKEKNNGDDSEDTNSEVEITHGFLYVIGLGFIFMLMFTMKTSADYLVYSAFKPSIYSLLFSLSALTLFIIILTLLNYIDFIDDSDFYMETIYTGLTLFSLLWGAFGVITILTSQAISISWEKYEDDLCKQKLTAENTQFGIMRKMFIVNPNLPVASEYALRPDFNFAEYLKRCLGNNLSKFFTINWLSFIILTLIFMLWRVMLKEGTLSQLIFLYAGPWILLVIVLVSLYKCIRICKMLVPSTGEGLLIEYDYNSDINIPIPGYLTGKLAPPSEDMTLGSIYLLKLTCSYIFLGVFPNRHQLLFWYDCYGPKFLASLIQTVGILICFWVSLIILYFFKEIFDDYQSISISLLCVNGIVIVVLISYLIPLWIKFFTIASGIEMMRNADMIREVVENTQSERMQRNWRLMRQFRSLWVDMKRTEGTEKLKKLPEGLKKAIRESFYLSSRNDFLEYFKVKSVLYRIGIEMDNDQFRVFLKDCEMEEDDTVSFMYFEKGVQRMMADRGVTVKQVVVEVLRHHLNKKVVSLAELSTFFEEHKWFMRDLDIHDFLIDLHFILDENGKLNIEQIEIST